MIEANSSSSAVRPCVGFLGGGLGVLTFYLKNIYIWSRGVGWAARENYLGVTAPNYLGVTAPEGPPVCKEASLCEQNRLRHSVHQVTRVFTKWRIGRQSQYQSGEDCITIAFHVFICVF